MQRTSRASVAAGSAVADDLNHASQFGRTFHVFDWTGVAPVGELNIVSPYLWDASRLYSAGEITFVGVPEASSLGLALMALAGGTLTARRRLAEGASARSVAIAPCEKGELL
jgi:hypothetical protein